MPPFELSEYGIAIDWWQDDPEVRLPAFADWLGSFYDQMAEEIRRTVKHPSQSVLDLAREIRILRLGIPWALQSRILLNAHVLNLFLLPTSALVRRFDGDIPVADRLRIWADQVDHVWNAVRGRVLHSSP